MVPGAVIDWNAVPFQRPRRSIGAMFGEGGFAAACGGVVSALGGVGFTQFGALVDPSSVFTAMSTSVVGTPRTTNASAATMIARRTRASSRTGAEGSVIATLRAD